MYIFCQLCLLGRNYITVDLSWDSVNTHLSGPNSVDCVEAEIVCAPYPIWFVHDKHATLRSYLFWDRMQRPYKTWTFKPFLHFSATAEDEKFVCTLITPDNLHIKKWNQSVSCRTLSYLLVRTIGECGGGEFVPFNLMNISVYCFVYVLRWAGWDNFVWTDWVIFNKGM